MAMTCCAPLPSPAAFAAGSRCPYALDLHVHTMNGSADSSLSASDLGVAARASGLAGLMVTEHFRHWTRHELEFVSEAQGILVLSGREWSTNVGHVISLGLDSADPALRDIVRLRDAADESGALLVAAHPFRHYFDIAGHDRHPSLLRTREEEETDVSRYPVFQYVDAVEVSNANCTVRENLLAAEVADRLRLPVTAGSDAHYGRDLGASHLHLRSRVTSVAELIEALRSFDYDFPDYAGA